MFGNKRISDALNMRYRPPGTRVRRPRQTFKKFTNRGRLPSSNTLCLRASDWTDWCAADRTLALSLSICFPTDLRFVTQLTLST